MIVIREALSRELRQARRRAFADELFGHMKAHFPVEHRVFGDEALRGVVALGMRRAEEHGLRAAGHVCRYVTVMGFLGSHFDRDPQLPWAAELLADRREDARGCARLLAARALTYIGRIAGADGRHHRRALVRARRLRFAELGEETSGVLSRVHPQKYATLGAAARDELIALAGRKAVRGGLDTREGRTLMALNMLLSGAHFDEDPLHGWAADVLQKASTPDDKAFRLHQRARQVLDEVFERGGMPEE